MQPNDAIRIRHMIEAAETSQDFIAGRQRSDVDTDQMLRFALVRAIEIIGEAASKVSTETRALTASVPWAAIISMRNRLIHAYFDVNHD
ncbi:MAG: HepT-like ribonuclease domain-containing protein, partial [Pseudomonadota bacterium]